MRPKEFERQRRVTSQSLSAHTSLAEIYRRRRRVLVMSIIVFSVAATALAFTDEHTHIDIVFEAALPVWAGVLSALVFALALADLFLDWNKVAAAHEDAARRLGALAALQRSAKVENGVVDSGTIDLESEYWSTMNSIERIPNRYFVKLKAKHLRKEAQSRALDGAPSTSLLVLRAKLRLEDTWRVFQGGPPDEVREDTFLPDEARPLDPEQMKDAT